ncbi:hypothetical protein HJG60_011301 [Phyllostomus discolor]|uniref:Uncharacterized protein n=1 Tax=Phyllostomus discolor TaxID=89673 RepID=A0A834A7M3_9CHIR|nr:hypothetical protein HJG60_011301 [Phyllostomus discolor]
MLFSQYHLTSVPFCITGIIAGVNEFRIIMDPNAVAIAYSLHNKVKAEKHELIFDLGEFKCKHEEDISENKRVVHCLCTACECTKCTLSLFQHPDTVRRALQDAKLEKSQTHDIILVGSSTHILMIQKPLQDFLNGKEVNGSINPDEAVAYCAAVLSGNKSENFGDFLLLGVTPFSLSIETSGRAMTVLIKHNYQPYLADADLHYLL